MDISFISRIDDCPASSWDKLANDDYPFSRHRFLAALEHSGSVGDETGWTPSHVLVHEDGELLAAMPLYLKTHSYGEYVFDWSWADAYHRNGLDYYPKLVSAIPFTPAGGPRLLCAGEDLARVCAALVPALADKAAAEGASSWHVLFVQPGLRAQLEKQGLVTRTGVQYHWFNPGYQSYDDFLDHCTSRKRKNLRKERQRVADQGISLHRFEGEALTPALWQTFYRFYQLTYAKRSGHGGYLRKGFFEEIGDTMDDSLVLVMAQRAGQWIAGALNFRGADTLYGRYWGCIEEWDMLHFETCYYQGIDYCIEQGLKRFDPGAQGEHKIQRGFAPTITESCHQIQHPDFARAIAAFVIEERRELEHYRREAANALPFRKDT